jgi:hypothetical protein
MTDISPRPWDAPAAPSVGSGGRAPILLGVPERTGQRRLTVLLRAILVLPHLVVLSVLGIVAEVIAVIGWFGALFTGRLPRFAEDYLSGYLHWQVRVYAYYVLLTDAYPPFSFGDSDYPVRVAVPPPGPLNRLAVLFRIILVIPAAIVGGLLVWGGWTIVLFIAWLITLVTGTMPASLYQAYAAVLRYYTRYLGYLVMLTSEYPSEIFGDQPSPGQVPVAPDEAGHPATGLVGVPGQPAGDAAGPGSLRSPVGPAPETVPFARTTAASPGQLVLSDGARKLVGLFLALGVILIVAYIVVIAVVVSSAANSTVTRNNAITQVQASYGTLSRTLSSFQARSSACQGNLQCVTALDRQASRAFDTFGTSVRGTAMPNGATTTAAGRLVTASLAAGQLLQRLGSATTAAQYEATINSTDVQQILSQVDAAYQNLGTQLNTP